MIVFAYFTICYRYLSTVFILAHIHYCVYYQHHQQPVAYCKVDIFEVKKLISSQNEIGEMNFPNKTKKAPPWFFLMAPLLITHFSGHVVYWSNN